MPKGANDPVVNKYLGNLDDVSKLFKEVNLTQDQKDDMNALLKWYDSASEKLAKNTKALSSEENALYALIASLKEFNRGGKKTEEILANLGKGNDKLAKSFKALVENYEETEDKISNLNYLYSVLDKSEGKNKEIVAKVIEEYVRENNLLKENNELLRKRAEAENEQRTEKLTQGYQKVNESLKTVAQTARNLGQEIGGAWAKAHQAAAEYAKSVGVAGASMDKFREDTINFVSNQKIAGKYNTSIEELIKLQQEYSSQTQRNIRLSESQKETFVATARVLGNEKALDFTAKLENFGIGMEKSGKLAKDMFDTAVKSGVNFDKYSKNVSDNLTLVQAYGFRNGVQGLATMARKATELKLNMQQVAAFADKVSTVEGAITTAANLQVLGGPFSAYADPMGMLYEGLNDLEGLQDRIVKMMSSLGNFNKATGQVQLDAFNRVRVKEAAKLMGVSAEEMFRMINRAGVMNEIQNQLQNTGIAENEEMMQYLKNVATFNKNGEAVVDLGDGRGEVKVSELNADSDLAKLRKLNQTEGEDIRDIAKLLRGWDDIMQGAKKQIEATKAQAVERTGLGKTVLGIAKTLTESNFLLKMIAYGSIAGSIVQAGLNAGGSIYGTYRYFGGAKAAGTGAGAGVGGRVAGGKVPAGSGSGSYGGHIGGRLNPANNVTINSRGNEVVRLSNGKEIEFAKNKLGRVQAREVVTGRYASPKDVGKATKALSAGEKAMSAAGQRAIGAAVGGIAAGAFSGVMHAVAGDFSGKGREGREQRSKAIGGTVGATIGGALGTLIPIPVVGQMIGSMAGEFIGSTIGGTIAKHSSKKRDEKREEIINDFKYNGGSEGRAKAAAIASLEGDYTRGELEKIRKAFEDGKIEEGELSKRLLKKMDRSGDAYKLEGLQDAIANSKIGENMSVKNQHATVENATFNIGRSQGITKEMGIGGYVNGVPHEAGGNPILGTNISVEGGEYVVNKESTAEFFPVIDWINSRKSQGTAEPVNGTFKFEPGGVIPVKDIQESRKDVVVATAPANKEVSQVIINNYYYATSPAIADGSQTLGTTVALNKVLKENINSVTKNSKLVSENTRVNNTFANSNVGPVSSNYSFANESSIVKNQIGVTDIVPVIENGVSGFKVGPQVKGTPDSYILRKPEMVVTPAKDNIKSGIQPLTVAPSKVDASGSEWRGGKLELAPLKIDISGTINLNAGGRNVDITSLINTPGFITQLSQIIENRLSESALGGNFKEARKNKAHTYM